MKGTAVPSADAFFLHVEHSGAAQHVGGVVVLEPTDRRPSIDAVRAQVAGGFARLPRMHQCLAPSTRWRRPRWVEADHVDLAWHVVEHRSPDGYAGLLRYVGELAEQPMPRDRPLWRIVLVRDIGPNGADALVVLVHHAIADGIGTVLQAMNLFEPRAAIELPSGRVPRLLTRATAVTIGLAQLATDGTAKRLPSGSSRRAFATVGVRFDEVRRIAATRGVRVTDLLIALLADGVHAVSPGLPGAMRFSVTTMLRTPDSTAEGNATGAIIVEVPVDGRPFDELLAEVSVRTARLRRPTRALASRFVVATGLRIVPVPFAEWFASTVYGPRFLHAVVSNMPGPTMPMTFAGVPHHATYPILPLVPGTPLAVGALSWAGVFGIGLATDPELIDGAALADRVNSMLGRLRAGPLEGEEEASA